MDNTAMWLSLGIAVGLSAVAIYFAIAPLLKPGKATLLLEDDKLTELLERKDTTLKAIKDLEFDYRVGKIDEEDYQRMDQRLRRQAIGLIQQIEKLAPASSGVDDQIETMVARMRKVPTATPIPATVAVAAAAGNGRAQKSATPQQAAARFCTNCGEQVETGHKFCAHCGTPVATPEAVAEKPA